MGYRQGGQGNDPRTPMAWQHRDINYRDPTGGGNMVLDGRYEAYSGNGSRRASASSPRSARANTPAAASYGGPPTPGSAHSRKTRTPDHRRRDVRGSSSDR